MSLWRGTVCTNCKKEHECTEAERMFKSGAIVYGCSACVPKPQTNADHIRAMSDEELAHLLHTAEEHIFNGNLWNYKQWQTWLKAPVEVQE